MLVIVRGLPGSGKTYLAQQDYPGHLLLEGDQYYMTDTNKYEFGEGMLKSSSEYVKMMLATALSTGIKSVVITTTSPDGKRALEYASIAKGFGHKTKFVWIDFENGNTNQNRHGLPASVIEKMKEDWREIPHEIKIERVRASDMFVADQCKHVVRKESPEWFRSLQAMRESKNVS